MTSRIKRQGKRWAGSMLAVVMALGTLPMADLAQAAASRGTQVRRPAKPTPPPPVIVVPPCKRGVPGVSPC